MSNQRVVPIKDPLLIVATVSSVVQQTSVSEIADIILLKSTCQTFPIQESLSECGALSGRHAHDNY
jgi:hypothetical protein